MWLFQLGDNSVTAVSSNGTDSSVTDGNDDALNSSNSDDNDSNKAKKKNRCVLCRKKVGLTGTYLHHMITNPTFDSFSLSKCDCDGDYVLHLMAF